MSMFKNLKSEGLEESQDRLGGFSPLESGLYPGLIKALYAGKSKGGAVSVTLIADVGGGKEYRETFYVTNKKGENFYTVAATGKKNPLPGFSTVDDLCLIATGKPLSEQETEEKVINIYNWEAKKEEPTSVDMLTEAIGQSVLLGIIKRTVNKNVKVGEEYVPTEETKDENAVDKVFHPEQRVTVPEARAGLTTGKFIDSWDKKNTGVTQDRRDLKDGSKKGGKAPSSGGSGGTGGAPRKSLFGK